MHQDDGQRRVWFGAIVGVVAALVLLAVASFAYSVGEDDDRDDRVVEAVDDGASGVGEPSDGRVVRVVEEDHHDFRPGFIFFPLLLILLVVFAIRGSRGWGHGWGYRGGWHRMHGAGPPWMAPDDPRAGWLEDWHRRAHGGEVEAPTAPTPPTSTGSGDQPEEPPASS
jgi:hypothetical protein